MLEIKELINQELNKLNEEQLKQVIGFIASIKVRHKETIFLPDESQLAKLYIEFAEEDKALAEEGIDNYAEMLRKED